MTIGIAAYGPNAGRAILAGLAVAEKIGRGAIGGFVSLAVIGNDGKVHRAETQRGGTGGLLSSGGLAEAILSARHAVLMSSGPDRPTPLSQFTPADATAGLVTGHRFPNMPGTDGQPINSAVLEGLRRATSPHDAVTDVLERNPTADAGVIALSLDGRLFAANSRYLSTFSDLGGGTLQSETDPSCKVGVLHNAIHPRRGLALIVAEIALDAMETLLPETGEIRLMSGIPVRRSDRCRLHVDNDGKVEALDVVSLPESGNSVDIGYGPEALVCQDGRTIGTTLREPYLVVKAGILYSINGQVKDTIPFRLRPMTF